MYLGRVIYLGLSRERWVVIDADELRALEGVVAEELVRMERLLVDPSQGVARAPQAYQLATNRARCSRCAFLEPCKPAIAVRLWETAVPLGARGR